MTVVEAEEEGRMDGLGVASLRDGEEWKSKCEEEEEEEEEEDEAMPTSALKRFPRTGVLAYVSLVLLKLDLGAGVEKTGGPEGWPGLDRVGLVRFEVDEEVPWEGRADLEPCGMRKSRAEDVVLEEESELGKC